MGRWIALAAAAAMVAACASGPYARTTLTFDGRVPTVGFGDADDLTVARVAAQLLHDTVGLPFPDGTVVHLYQNQATFAEGLIRDAALDRDDAWDKSRFAGAVATPRGLFFRADHLVSMRLLDRIAIMAHELAHVSQMEMGRGGRFAAAVWIREGHAEWAKFQVLDRLGIRSYADSREEVRRALVRSTTPVAFFPRLDALTNTPDWTAARNRFGSAATYGQAFLAVDWLVERYGADHLHALFRSFAAGTDRGGRWNAVYPTAYAAFVDEFRERLRTLAE